MRDSRAGTGRPVAGRDLWALVGGVALTVFVVVTPVIRETPLRTVVGAGFVLFVPGYACLVALFPEQSPASTDADSAHQIDGVEQLVLSLATSLAVASLVGLTLRVTLGGITLAPVVLSLGGLTLGFVALAHARRVRLEPASGALKSTGGQTSQFDTTNRTEPILSAILVFSVVLAGASVVFAVTTQTENEGFTELSLLTETDNGTLVAQNYPQNFSTDERPSLVAAIKNNEGEETSYTLVVELQRTGASNGSRRVQTAVELHRYQVTLQPNEQWRRHHTIEPALTGEQLRLQYLLYRDDPPSNPSATTAYRTVHLNVTSSQP